MMRKFRSLAHEIVSSLYLAQIWLDPVLTFTFPDPTRKAFSWVSRHHRHHHLVGSSTECLLFPTLLDLVF
jgi:hypothetical protein